MTGIGRADRTVRDAWAALADVSDGRGSVLLAAQVRAIADALAARAHDPTWTPGRRRGGDAPARCGPRTRPRALTS